MELDGKSAAKVAGWGWGVKGGEMELDGASYWVQHATQPMVLASSSRARIWGTFDEPFTACDFLSEKISSRAPVPLYRPEIGPQCFHKLRRPWTSIPWMSCMSACFPDRSQHYAWRSAMSAHSHPYFTGSKF